MTLIRVTEECGCDPRNVWCTSEHKPDCPVLKHFDIDGLVKKGVVLTIRQPDGADGRIF